MIEWTSNRSCFCEPFFFFNLKRNVLIFEEREPHGKKAKVSIIILFFVIFIFDLLVLILIFRFFVLFVFFLSSNDFVLISQYLSIWSETVLIVPSSETSWREGNDGSIIQRSTLILVSLNIPVFLIILMFFLLSFSFHRP